MKINNEVVDNYITMKYNFVGIRILEEALIPTSWSLSVNFVAIASANVPISHLEESGNYAYQKVLFWLQSTLHNIIMVSTQNEYALDIANVSNNIMLHSPDEPTDDLIVQMLHSKISAISKHNLFIGEMTLESADTNVSYTFAATNGYQLPTKMGGYVHSPAYHRKPWWSRADGFCFELLRHKGAKETLAELYDDVEDPLELFDAELREYEQEYEVRQPAEIIQVDKWVPKKV